MSFAWYNSSSPGPFLGRIDNFVSHLTEIAPVFGLTELEINNLLAMAEDLKTKWDKVKHNRPVQRIATAERDKSIRDALNMATTMINWLKRNPGLTKDYSKTMKIDTLRVKAGYDGNTVKKIRHSGFYSNEDCKHIMNELKSFHQELKNPANCFWEAALIPTIFQPLLKKLTVH